MASTMKRLAPRFGTTAQGLREALVNAGLVDPREKRPTRIAHALGCVYYYERDKTGKHMRFPVWNPEQLKTLVPSLSPSRADVLRSFSSRHSAGRAIRTNATLLRELQPRLADALATLASDQTLETIENASRAKDRLSWGQATLVPALNRLHAAIGSQGLEGESLEALQGIEGAIQWVSTTIRAKAPSVQPVRLHEEPSPKRHERAYDDAHSVAISIGERHLIESGYALNHLRPRPEDIGLVGAVLTPLSRRVAPDAPEAWHRTSANQPMRATRHRGRLAIATIARLPGGHLLASAHAATIAADRLTVQTEVAGYLMIDASGQVVDSEGDQAIGLWLSDMISDETGGPDLARTRQALADGKTST